MKTPTQYVEEALQAESEERLVDALRGFRDALGLEPTHEEALLGVARLSYVFGDLQEALEDYSGVLTRNPRCAEAYRGRAWCLFAIGEAEKALQDVHRAIALEPAELESWFSRGQLQLEMGLFDDAERDFRYVLEHLPQDADAALELARCLVERARFAGSTDAEVLDEVAALCERAREGLGEDGMIRLIEAERAVVLGDTEGAAEHLHVALTLDAELVHEVAERPHLHGALAYLRAQAG